MDSSTARILPYLEELSISVINMMSASGVCQRVQGAQLKSRTPVRGHTVPVRATLLNRPPNKYVDIYDLPSPQGGARSAPTWRDLLLMALPYCALQAAAEAPAADPAAANTGQWAAANRSWRKTGCSTTLQGCR